MVSMASPDGCGLVASDLQRQAGEFLGDHRRCRQWRAFYGLLHAAPPVDLGGGHWLIAGYDDLTAVMEDEGAVLTSPLPTTRLPVLNELFLALLPNEHGAEHRR